MSGSEYISFGGGLALHSPNEYGSTQLPTAVGGLKSPRLLPQLIKKSLSAQFLLAGVVGFEPTDVGVRVQCLTAWLYPTDCICIVSKKFEFCKHM